MRDDDISCCSAEQTAWIDLIKGLRSHVIMCINKKSKISLNMLGGLTELTSHIMYLHTLANSFDDKCDAMKAKQKKKIRSFD